MREIDFEQFVLILKDQGVDTSEVELYLENAINSSNVSTQLPGAQ